MGNLGQMSPHDHFVEESAILLIKIATKLYVRPRNSENMHILLAFTTNSLEIKIKLAVKLSPITFVRTKHL